MDCDALEDERLKEVLQAKNEELIRQNEELKGENKRLRSNNETSNCDRLLIRPQQPQPVLGQHPWKYNKWLVKSVSLKVEGGKYQLSRFLSSILSCFKRNVKFIYFSINRDEFITVKCFRKAQCTSIYALSETTLSGIF